MERTPQLLTSVSTARLLESMETHGVDSHMLGLGTDLLLSIVYASIPNPPVFPATPLAARSWARDGGGGADNISRLPNAALCKVVSHLPTKDTARTTVLSSRWRYVWYTTPLVLVDTHLIPDAARGGDDGLCRPSLKESRAVTAAVSHILAVHPGPFRCVHLTCSYMDAHRAEVVRWLQLLAAKGVEDLAFVNRPFPFDLRLSGELFHCASLTHPYLDVWRFSDTAALLHGAAFPKLQELSFCFNIMEDWDLAFLLARCPVLEKDFYSGPQSMHIVHFYDLMV